MQTHPGLVIHDKHHQEVFVCIGEHNTRWGRGAAKRGIPIVWTVHTVPRGVGVDSEWIKGGTDGQLVWVTETDSTAGRM